MESVNITINGQDIDARFEKGTTLLQYLRNTACLKGAKESCGTGHCGACTVIIDGEAKRSCVTRMERLQRASITTIEGLISEGQVHPIQKAFLDVGAVQCGFCTPGMIIATKALLDKNPTPSRQEIMEGLKKNYCRCTGYVKIIEAVEMAAKWLSGNADAGVLKPMEETTIVIGETGADMVAPRGIAMGKALWDMDGIDKANGSLKYTDDYEMPSMLHGAVVWSQRAHAKILSIDYSAALEMPGVVSVIDHQHVPGTNGIGLLTPDFPVFAKNEVNMIADCIALVVADTAVHARAAAKKVVVEYEDLPAIFDMEVAKEQESLFGHIFYDTGKVDELKKSDNLLVLNNVYDIPRQEHACMETESTFAYMEEGKLILYATTQSPYELREMISGVMNMPENDIQIIAPPLGGAFGKKCDPYMEGAASVAAFALNRPVKITLNRKESIFLTTKRHPYKIDYEIGLKPDGQIQYIDARFLSDGGAYMTLSPAVLEQSMIFSCGPYRIPGARVDGYSLKTNNVLCGAFRGFGINQAAIAIEVALDMAAEKLGLDPFEIRLRNALKQGDITFTGQCVDYSVGIIDTVKICRSALRKEFAEYKKQYPVGDKVLGWGMASGFKNVGVGKGVVDDGGAIFTKKADASIELRVSGVDMGQGFRTAMRQLAAEALGEDIDNIHLVNGDTELTLRHGQAVSERQTLNSGHAVVEAAKLLLKEMEENPWYPGEERSAQFEYVAPKTYALHDEKGRREAGDKYRNYPSYAYTTQAAIIEVDKKSGEVKVLKVVAVHDVGRVINPNIIEGQIEGSCSMGIGWALTEIFEVEQGMPKQQIYSKLGLPTIDETPLYNITLVENPEPEGPFGAKGISEVATVPMTPAVMNAVYNATGLRFMTLPITKEMIVEGLKDKNV
ncbi:molybdopterin-dependent oxidoreductase [Desulforhopalus singaporensis]|uniref:Xanthine dehydrogenase, molybdenum binding subunit apoprotein n=1 Tax=Desulforhopalus singaporensis TaxID=91360 RepID=A0A1H0V2D0_9BACT|nr:molybdopterin cofactor-binding domain-containing protein [Desulforhopalus singaporensis]SDP72524.1 xanthine dehydrogenase, molybdenum binding subunit apoprotein [Desulforhopalus singaporensis]